MNKGIEGLESKDHLDKISPPWKGNFYQLISLWEIMQSLQAYAHDMANFLSKIVVFIKHFDEDKSEVSIDDPSREIAYGWLNSVVPQAKELGLNLSLKGIYRAQSALKHDSSSEVAIALDAVYTRMIDELKSVMFLHIEPNHVEMYNEKKLFGQVVVDKLSTAISDIQEAGKCFALQRFTACVFHLMRVMEKAVQLFGKKLIIKLDPKNETWYQILIHVNKAIDKLPNNTTKQKTKKLKYKAASAHLDNVRIAWRNEVMHPKQTYTQEEAEDVISSVRIFVNDLAGIL